MPILIYSAKGGLSIAPLGWVWGCWAPHFRSTWPRQNRCQLHKFAASLPFDQCEGYYYSFMSKRAQRHGGALRGDKSRVGIKMPKLITSARGQ